MISFFYYSIYAESSSTNLHRSRYDWIVSYYQS